MSFVDHILKILGLCDIILTDDDDNELGIAKAVSVMCKARLSVFDVFRKLLKDEITDPRCDDLIYMSLREIEQYTNKATFADRKALYMSRISESDSINGSSIKKVTFYDFQLACGLLGACSFTAYKTPFELENDCYHRCGNRIK